MLDVIGLIKVVKFVILWVYVFGELSYFDIVEKYYYIIIIDCYIIS